MAIIFRPSYFGLGVFTLYNKLYSPFLILNLKMGKIEQPSSHLLDDKRPAPANKAAADKHGRLLLLLGGAIVFIVVALALGLGLGLGLKRHHSASPAAAASSSPTTSSSPTNSTASENLQSWRRDTAEYNLDMGWDINAAPTTRIFNLTVSEIQAAPDGEFPLDHTTVRTDISRCCPYNARLQFAVPWPTHQSQPRRSRFGQCHKPVDQCNGCPLAWPLPKRNKLDGRDFGNNAMPNSTWNELSLQFHG